MPFVSSPEPLTKLCANCGFRLEASLLRCPLDGLQLGPASPSNQVLGPYKLVRRLGRGGMGVVYQAENERLGRHVALKLLHRGLHGDQVVVDRFFLEARAVNTIRHPHVVETYDLVSTERDLYMVMEYLEGDDLASLLSKSIGQPWPVPRVAHILEQICGALLATHRRGIIHRDLKPANIFLTHRRGAADFVKVLDFGIVKLASEGGRLTLEGLTMGTPEYMSPEQVRGEDIDGRSDLYALGCIAFEMLTGHQLFGGGAHADVMLAQLHKAPSSLRSWNPDVPAALDALILRCLAKEASDRPASAYVLAQELARATGRPFDVTGAFGALTPQSLAVPTEVAAHETFTGPRPVEKRASSSGDVDAARTSVMPVVRPRWWRWPWALAAAGALGALAAVLLASRATPAPPTLTRAVAPAELVRIQLQTEPPGAVVVDLSTGEVWGRTPLERSLARHSRHQVRFDLAGFESTERSFEVTGVSAVAVALAPAPPPAALEPAPEPVESKEVRRKDRHGGTGRSRPQPASVPERRIGAGTIDPFSR